MTAFSFGARLHLGANSDLALSLPQSFVAAKRRQKPAPSSEGAEAAPPHSTELQRCKPRLSPPLAGCPHPSRCSAKAQHRATFPKEKAKAALESQTPQREPRRLRRKPQIRFAAFPPLHLQSSFCALFIASKSSSTSCGVFSRPKLMRRALSTLSGG